MVSLIFGIKHDADEHTYETVTDLHRKQTFREEERGERRCVRLTDAGYYI